jgi:hypothetical protein
MALCLFAGACGFEPDSLPEPTPNPNPNPGPDPDPIPDPVPNPEPDPEPDPIPDPTPEPPASSAKAITGFIVGVAGETLNIGAQTVTVTVPWGTPLTGVTPDKIDISGKAAISPKPEDPQDFLTASGFSPVTYIVTAEDKTTAQWTVTVKWGPLASGDISNGIGNYLSNPPSNTGDGSDKDHPIILPVNINLASDWAVLLTVINKFVALDLSESTGMTVFDPGTANTGESKIVSLVLPDKAESVKAGSGSSDSTFKNFIALKSVAGSNVETIGQYAFYGCTSLTEVNLPEATDIGNNAFQGCTTLEEVSLPNATTISSRAFYGCASLTEVSLPSATTIGAYAFSDCDALETLSLPNATSIGANVFYESFNGVVSLTIILGKAAPTLGVTMFSYVSSMSVIVQVPSGATGYDDTWKNNFTGGNAGISLTIEYAP